VAEMVKKRGEMMAPLTRWHNEPRRKIRPLKRNPMFAIVKKAAAFSQVMTDRPL